MAHGEFLPYPDRRWPDLVIDRARQRPTAVAVRQWDETLTYHELCTVAGDLAARLRERGAKPGVLIGLKVDRRPSMIVGLLGVLMTGAAYVPLDPSLPPDRLRDIATEAGLSIIVTGTDVAGGGVAGGGVAEGGRGAWADCPAKADDLAYVMFTSGSTGHPKGVMISHDSLTEFVTNQASVAGLDHTCRMLAFASIGFDASVIDILTPLAIGGEVDLASEADRADPTRLQRFCADHRVTAAFLPPALLPVLEPWPDLRVVLTGSEAPGPEQVARWAGPNRRFFNLFGPTEMTVYVTWFEATGTWDRPLPIGLPAANHRVYVVDDQMRQAEAGELLVGGAGLAKGYLGAPDLTEERFIPDPFSAVPGARLYRTGDLVSEQADGTLEFIGRADRQVKIRGQRVELGEVEAVLRGHPDVGHAAVAVAPGPLLVAFVTGDVTPQALKDHCAQRLPAAMVPTRVVVVPELPLLSSGKVDLDRLEADYVAPSTPEESVVAEIWGSLLEVRRVGREDDFFDSGGHSITAMRLVTAIRERLSRDVAIEDVLEGRVLREIAARVAAAPKLGDQRPVRGRPPALSPSQQRLWFLERYSPEAAAAYNIILAERLRGPLDVAALQRALTAVAERHEILRWRIPDVDGVPYAILDSVTAVPLPIEDGVDLSKEVNRRFELASDALWRAKLFRLGPDDHILAITAHHAVFDGWSQSLLYNDLATAYSGQALAPLSATYADYVAWRGERQLERAESDLAWWVSHLDGVPTVVELAQDRPAEPSFAGASLSAWLPFATSSAVVLAALGIAITVHAGQADMVIGSPMVDRRHVDFEDMVGFFIEIAPMRLRTNPEASFAEHVRLARNELVAALAHPEAPLERIVQAFGLGGQVNRNPLVQVLFNMFNFEAPKLDLPGIISEPVPPPIPGSAFDLTLYGVERDGRTRLEVVYGTDLFDEDRMRAFLDTIVHVITSELVPVMQLVPPTALLAKPRPSRVDTPVTDPASTATERAIASVWCEVLGRAEIGASENFFDSGGSSLTIVMVQQRLNRLLAKNLRVVDLFRYPTIRSLGAHLDGSTADDAVELALRRGAARRDRRRGA